MSVAVLGHPIGTSQVALPCAARAFRLARWINIQHDAGNLGAVRRRERDLACACLCRGLVESSRKVARGTRVASPEDDHLGGQHDNPVYIETLPKRGYQFIASVTDDLEAFWRAPAGTATMVLKY